MVGLAKKPNYNAQGQRWGGDRAENQGRIHQCSYKHCLQALGKVAGLIIRSLQA